MNQPTADVDVSSSLDYGYSNIQNTYSGSNPADIWWFPTGSTAWIKDWFYKNKENGQ